MDTSTWLVVLAVANIVQLPFAIIGVYIAVNAVRLKGLANSMRKR